MSKPRRFALATAIAILTYFVSHVDPFAVGEGDAWAQSRLVPAKLSADEKRELGRIEAYLNAITTMTARFVQITDDGRYSEGLLYVHRPGRFRFEYAPPVPYLLVAKDGTLLFYDSKLKQVSYVDADDYPALQFLLAKRISFTRDLVVTGMNRKPGIIQIAMVQRSKPTEGQLVLSFSDAPFELRKWTTVDPQGVTINVALFNAKRGVKISPGKFSIADPTRSQRRRRDDD